MTPFSRRISVDGRPNRRNKTTFSNFCGVACTGTAERISKWGEGLKTSAGGARL